MAATTRGDLILLTEKELEKLIALIEPISEDAAMVKDHEDTSIKDVVAHRAHWIELFLGWYADGQAGRRVDFPAKGYKWSDLRRYNARLRESQAALGWDAARALLTANATKLLDFIRTRSEAALYHEPMKGARNDWTTGRWAEAAGPSHFRSAAKYIRLRLRAMAPHVEPHEAVNSATR